jgi:hypothetical protein
VNSEDLDGIAEEEGEFEDKDEKPPGYDTIRGYAWYAYPISEDADFTPYNMRELNRTSNRHIVRAESVGKATGILNEPREGAYLIVTYEDHAPSVFEDWEVEPAELDCDFQNEQNGTIRILRQLKQKHPEFEPFVEYEFETWD